MRVTTELELDFYKVCVIANQTLKVLQSFKVHLYWYKRPSTCDHAELHAVELDDSLITLHFGSNALKWMNYLERTTFISQFCIELISNGFWSSMLYILANQSTNSYFLVIWFLSSKYPENYHYNYLFVNVNTFWSFIITECYLNYIWYIFKSTYTPSSAPHFGVSLMDYSRSLRSYYVFNCITRFECTIMNIYPGIFRRIIDRTIYVKRLRGTEIQF